MTRVISVREYSYDRVALRSRFAPHILVQPAHVGPARTLPVDSHSVRDRKLRFRRERRPLGSRPVHSPLTVSNLSRDRYARIPANALRDRLPAPIRRRRHHTWRGRRCVSAPRLYGIQRLRHLPTAYSEASASAAVIIIISRLVIVIRGDDAAHCHRQINALHDRAPRSVVFDTIVAIVDEQGIVPLCVVLCALCIPIWIALTPDCFASASRACSKGSIRLETVIAPRTKSAVKASQCD